MFIFSFQLKRVLFLFFSFSNIFETEPHLSPNNFSNILQCLKSNYVFSRSEIWVNPQRRKSILKWYETANKMTLS